MKTAIVYDRVNTWGGAERVLLALHELFPEAPLYCGVYHPEKAPWAKVFPKVIPSFLNKFSFLRDKHQYLSLLMPFAFESFDFSKFDLVISVTSEFAKAIITRPPTKHICYCLTPTRYLWSGYEEYFKGQPLQGITKPIINYLKFYDKIAAYRPDKVIAISTEVQKRIKTYYNLDSEIIYPPVEIEKFQNPKSKIQTTSKYKIQNSKREYYLAVGRLVPYKRFDLLVETFNKIGERLLIIGTGSEERKLKQLAESNITFIKNISDDELVGYYQNAKALIFPQLEDFGIVPVEAQSAGIPVIAYKGGGALDTVVDGVTGLLFNSQTVDSLIDVLAKFDTLKFSSQSLWKNTQKFSKEVFKRKFKSYVSKI